MVVKDFFVVNGISWDDVLQENGKVLFFVSLQFLWLVELSCKLEFGKKFYYILVFGKYYVLVRIQVVIIILFWLVRNGFCLRDDLIFFLVKFIMELLVIEEEDVMGCLFFLNFIDVFYGVEVIEE